MKKWMVGILGLVMVIAISTVGFSQEYFPPPRDNSGIIGGRAGQGWASEIVYKITIKEMSAPSGDPSANTGWLYGKDVGGQTQLFWETENATATQIGGVSTWDTVADPAANASISLAGYSNVFTGTATNLNQNQFLNTGNMGDYAIVYIQQLTGTPTDGKLLYGTMASDLVDGIQIYSSDTDIAATGQTLLRLDFKDDDDTDGYYIVCRDNTFTETEFSVAMTGAVVVGPTITGSGALSIVTPADMALTLNAGGGDAASEDLVITAHNLALTANGLMTFSPDGALAIAINLEDTDIATAISVGANDIVGTTGLINYTNFDVNADGDVTCVDLIASGTVSVGIFKQDSLVPASGSPADIALNAGGTGGINIGSVSTGTITLGGAATLVNLPAATDLTLAGGMISVTDTANSNLVTLVNNTLTTASLIAASSTSMTSGKMISAIAGVNVTGDLFYAQATDASMTGYYFRAYNGSANDFTVMKHGATVISGDASGTAALTLTAGDILITSGLIRMGADPADAGAIRLSNNTYIESEKAVAGVDINIIGVDGSDIVQIASTGASGVVITPATTVTGILTLSANPKIYDGDSNYVILDAPNIAGDITVVLPATAGTVQLTTGTPAGFIIAAQTTGDILQSTDSTTWERLAGNTAGKFLRAGGVATKNAWSTLILPNSATQGDILHASSANTIGNLTAVATGQVLVSAGASTAPAWSASPTLTAITVNTMTHSNLTVSKPVFTNASGVLVSTGTMPVNQGGTNLTSYAVGDVLQADGTTSLAKLAAVSAGSYLRSAGLNTANVWSTIKIPNTCTTGDLQYGSASNVLSPLAIGSTNQGLDTVGGVPAWTDKNVFSYAALAMVPDSLVTFSTTQGRTLLWKLTSTSGTAIPVITAPNTSGQIFLIRNSTGQTVTIKVSGQSGSTIASTKTALAYCDGSDYLTVAMD